MQPESTEAARQLLRVLGAPPRLLRHVELVGEAAEDLLSELARRGVDIDASLVRVGVVLHDAGKTLHPAELDAPGAKHEPDGEALLLAHGVTPRVARICRTHARWSSMEVELEDLVVALADKLWKGVRRRALEERVVEEVARVVDRDRWALFIALDEVFERVASRGDERLERSRT